MEPATAAAALSPLLLFVIIGLQVAILRRLNRLSERLRDKDDS